MSNGINRDAEFISEAGKALKTVAEKYGLDVPEFQSFINGDIISMNISAYRESANVVYANLYKEKGPEVGLNPSWLNMRLVTANNIRLKILGLDLDGGDLCVRLEDRLGKHYLMTPLAVSHLMKSINPLQG